MSALPLVALLAIQSASGAPAPPQPACTAPEHRQLDFWVGRWDVYPTGKAALVAHSVIEKLYAGCTVRENWMPLSGGGGGSLNMYDPADRHWHQTWHDSSNARVVFEGGLNDGNMVLTGLWKGVIGPGKDGIVRMTYSPEAGGAVRQHGEVSTDRGATWTTSFDFTYKPSAAPK